MMINRLTPPIAEHPVPDHEGCNMCGGYGQVINPTADPSHIVPCPAGLLDGISPRHIIGGIAALVALYVLAALLLIAGSGQ